MSQLAYKSDGGHYFCEEPDELAGIFDQEFGRAMSVVAQKVIIEITCPEALDLSGCWDARETSKDKSHARYEPYLQ